MPIETSTITAEQRDTVLARDEDHFFDCKRIDITPSKLTKAISAFANADGGELWIGIGEDGSGGRFWHGFADIEDANDHLAVFDKLFPLGQYFSYGFLTCEGETGMVLQVEVRRTNSITCDINGRPYIRRGAASQPVEGPEALRRLELDKGIVSFEDEPVNTTLDTVTNSAPVIEFLLEQVPTAEPFQWLHKQHLLHNDERPLVAAVLLFAELPQAVLPKRCGIKICRYKTREAEGTREALAFDPISVEGHLYDLIGAAVKKTKEIIEGIEILGPGGDATTIIYPEVALHEIITNAVIHRDYSIPDDINVRIYENRVEIESPGVLAGHVTVDNILHERASRNGKIVRLINKFPNPPNKDVGEGLNTAFEAMKKLKLKEPVILQTANSVVVKLRHEPLASPEVTVMEYLEKHDEVNNSTARKLTGIGSENSMKRVFIRLIKQGLIEPIPGRVRGPRAAYRKP